jgi:cystathionine beta-lyase
MTNFDRIIPRKNTNSYKWDRCEEIFGTDDLIPMWVADMDFEAPKEVKKALKDRIEHGVFGYTFIPDSFYDSIIDWQFSRNNWKIEKDWIIIAPGVVPSIKACIQSFTSPGEEIIVQTPVYFPFFSSIRLNGRILVENPLKFSSGNYRMDFEDLERKINDKTRMLILCNPHNPVGRVWKKEELERLGEICLRNNITIVSDEIHSDLIMPGYKHTPIASISKEFSDITVTCTSVSKTFNLAGLSTSYLIISNPVLRNRYVHTAQRNGLLTTNIFGIIALEVSYRYGFKWLDDLIEYLRENRDFVKDFLKERIPSVKTTELEGTYLMWLNFRELGLKQEELKNLLYNEAKVGLQDGVMFGEEGDGFMRMNIACPRSTLGEAMKRMEKAIKKHLKL